MAELDSLIEKHDEVDRALSRANRGFGDDLVRVLGRYGLSWFPFHKLERWIAQRPEVAEAWFKSHPLITHKILKYWKYG